VKDEIVPEKEAAVKSIKNINVILVVPFFTMILLALSMPANADLLEGMHPVSMPNFNQGQTVYHQAQIKVTSPAHVELQHRVQPPQPVVHNTVNHTQVFHHDQPVPAHYRDLHYYKRHHDNSVYVVDNSDSTVLDEAAVPVLGTVVDSIPTDYQVVMADGINYLFSEGIYYQRVEQGFEVVEPPMLDQG
jgi:hypothetical protein